MLKWKPCRMLVLLPFSLCMFIALCSSAQSMDEYKQLFKKEIDPGKKAFYAAVLYPVSNNPDESAQIEYERAIRRARNTNEYGKLAFAIFEINSEINFGVMKSKLNRIVEIQNLARKFNEKNALRNMQIAEAYYYASVGEYASASLLYEQMYAPVKKEYKQHPNDLYSKHNYTWLLNNIGYHYFKVNENDRAIEYIEELVYTVDLKRFPEEYTTVLSNIGTACINGGKYRKAIVYFEKSIKVIKEKKIKNQENWNEYLLALCYMRMKQYNKAFGYLEKLKVCSSELGISTYCGVEWELVYLEKAKLALYRSQFDESEKYALTLEKAMPNYFSNDQIAGVYSILYKVNKQKGKDNAALRYLEKFKEHEDLHVEQQTKSNTEFREKFLGLEKSVYQEKLLYKMDEESRNASEKRQRVLIIVFTIIGFCLLVFAFWMYRLFYKLKQSTTKNDEYTQQISASLNEKEILLQEIHHRVKNNFQVISSLINIQANNLVDPAQIQPLMDAKNRVLSMSLVHQKLYTDSGNLGKINFGSFLIDIVGSMSEIYCQSADDLSFSHELDEVAVDLEKAVPLGLFCNEVITNCFKYGKRTSGKLNLTIELKDHGAYQTELIIRDSGPGFPENRVTSTTSIGDRLKEILSQQIEGVLSEYNEMGAVVKLKFYNIPAVSRVKNS
jgi:two-component system, sensor histidine kinase PdtaS